MKFSYLFFSITRPLREYLRSVYTLVSLKYRNPTLKLVGNVSVSNSTFGKYNYISNEVSMVNVDIGNFSYVGANSFLQNTKIGKFTCIGPDVKVGLGEHPSSTFISVHPIFYSTSKQVGISFADRNYFQEYQETSIGNDVWIGGNVVIKGGVIVGDGAIIASGAVVTKDVEPYSIVGGVPAKFIKRRFTEQQIEDIVRSEWWEQDLNWLKENYALMHNISNIGELTKKKTIMSRTSVIHSGL